MNPRLGAHIRENGTWYGAFLLILVMTVVLGYFVFTIDHGSGAHNLEVEEVIMSSHGTLGGTETDLTISVFLTNQGKGAIDDVRVRAFAVERDSNLARDEDAISMGRIEGETSPEGELHITVPNNDTYRIELLVFENGRLTLRGSGTIDLKGIGVASEYSTYEPPEMTGAGGDTEDNGIWRSPASSDEAFSLLMSAFCLLVIPGIIVVLVIIAVVKQGKKNAEKHRIVSPDGPSGDAGETGTASSRSRSLEEFTRKELMRESAMAGEREEKAAKADE